MKYIGFFSLLLLPFVASAQGLFDWIPSLLVFFNTRLIPFLIGVSFVVIAFNVVRFFILGINGEGDKKQGVASGRAKAKAYALYSVLAFVFITTFWGLVNLLVGASGLQGGNAATSDYIRSREESGPTGPNPACIAPTDPYDICICSGGDPVTCTTT